MRTLRAALEDFFPGRPLTVVLGAMEDKDWPAMCRVIAPLAGRMRVAPTGSERGASVEKLERACKEANPGAEVTRHASIEEALGVAGDDEVVVVTGSLHLVGAALEWARPERGGEHAERGLNDWTPRKAKG
jgi:dihydrofolate synthase/folylpolyglutamate synthase